MIHNNNILQGIVVFASGILLLLYALNILTAGVTILLIAVSIGLILYGASLAGIDSTVKKLFNRLNDYYRHGRKKH